MDSGQPILGTNNGELRVEYENGRLMVSRAGTDIMLAGNDLEGDIVVKIAKPGVDVKTAADDELVFNSAQNGLKIVATDTVTETFNRTGVFHTLTIPHGLGYTPAYLVYYLYPGTTKYHLLPVVTGAWSGAPGSKTNDIAVNIHAYTDSSNLYIDVDVGNSTGSETNEFRYYLLQETAN